MAISLTIDGKEAALKKGSSIEYVSENRIFTDADDYSLEIELPVGYFSHARQCPSKLALHSLNRKSADCPQNIAILGLITRKDIDEPLGGFGYSRADREQGGNGYVPVSLQYKPYVARTARETSIAGGDPKEAFTNRSYRGKRVTTHNECDLDLIIATCRLMGDRPVIVSLNMSRPAVVAEFEPYVDAIVVSFGVQNKAKLDIISGAFEPQGLLPFQMPADMLTVEAQCEDVPHDMTPYCDADGNIYDFAFGLNWSGLINDHRTARYRHRRK